MKYLRALLLMVVWLPLVAVAVSSGPIEGRILQAGTNAPVAGAIVVVRWKGYFAVPFGTSLQCYHVENAVTDGAGRFRTSAWSGPIKGAFFVEDYYEIDPYKAGSESYEPQGFISMPEYNQNVRYLTLFKGAKDERMEALAKQVRMVWCAEAGASGRNLYEVMKAIYYEAKPLAISKQDEGTLRWIRERAAYQWISPLVLPETNPSEVDALVKNYLTEHLK